MPSAKYTPSEIEPKWQKYWETNKTFCVANPGQPGFDASKPKYYILDMFPYPSGAGLHVGHPEGYTATDILARYKRMKGFNVLHPMGWDAYGLPAEQYAIEHNVHPAETTRTNIANMKRQIQSLGFSYDWDREIDTTDPKYYKWTQWIFQQLYKKGLAYCAEVPVWWCEGLGTVLANEEVIDGRSERGDYPCVRRPLRQWMLKITAYAERLLEDLEGLDWPESIKASQRNWIGKSEGAEVKFLVYKPDIDGGSGGEILRLRVFTTRPDTLFGATYMVVAPEHPYLKSITTAEQKAAVEAYALEASKKSDLARTELAQDKEKTGVFTGAYAHNPVYQVGDPRAKIPIWVADYVLMGYGTGAIMAVPAHDTRDAEFAVKFNLPITPVVMPTEKWLKANAPKGMEQETPEHLMKAFQEKPGSFKGFFTDDGIAFNSPLFNGQTTPEAKKTIVKWLEEKQAGRGAVNYKLRDWLFSRQRYWGEPFPVMQLEDGSYTLVPEADLPVTLPEMSDFKPTGTIDPPLSKAKDWVNTTDPISGKPAKREVNTMPQWAGSSWYYLRYLDAQNSKEFCSKEAENYWMPVDLYIGGAEHAVLHLLYARFWHKVLYDIGVVHTKEPFQGLFNQGLIQAFSYKDETGRQIANDQVEERGEGKYIVTATQQPASQFISKMSKSYKNSVNPDDVVKEFGADTLRLYEMFMGPLNSSKPWNPRDVPGVFRFLQRSWRLLIEDDDTKPGAGELRANLKDAAKAGDPDLERALNKLMKKVSQDLEGLAFNTGISAMMIFLNEAFKKPDGLSKSQAERYVLTLAPFAPHLAEELWTKLGHGKTLAYEAWPTFDEKLTVDALAELPVQVNGKLRGKITVAPDATEDVMKAAAQEAVAKELEGKTIVKAIVVKGRMVNFVVK